MIRKFITRSTREPTFLAEYSNREAAIALLKQYRPYLEMLPSLRPPEKSIITIPLPLIRILPVKSIGETGFSTTPPPETLPLPCDLAIIMCDPEWQIKLGVEILIFIHRPDEDFSDLLMRWRKSQIYLNQNYEWLMPLHEEHIFSEVAEKVYPLFIIFEQPPPYIQRGLEEAYLPYFLQQPSIEVLQEIPEIMLE